MEKNTQIGLYIFWSFILIIELLWFHSINSRPHHTTDIIFAVTVIAVTTVIGSVGLSLLKNGNR